MIGILQKTTEDQFNHHSSDILETQPLCSKITDIGTKCKAVTSPPTHNNTFMSVIHGDDCCEELAVWTRDFS